MANYKVGRGRPPKGHSWQKGISGNPRGRPKGRRSLSSTIEAALKEKIEIEENGEKRTVTRLDAIVSRLIEDSIRGHVQSLRALAALMPAEDSAPPVNIADLAEQDRKLIESLSRRFADPGTN